MTHSYDTLEEIRLADIRVATLNDELREAEAWARAARRQHAIAQDVLRTLDGGSLHAEDAVEQLHDEGFAYADALGIVAQHLGHTQVHAMPEVP